jgi:hypothetical protein
LKYALDGGVILSEISPEGSGVRRRRGRDKCVYLLHARSFAANAVQDDAFSLFDKGKKFQTEPLPKPEQPAFLTEEAGQEKAPPLKLTKGGVPCLLPDNP